MSGALILAALLALSATPAPAGIRGDIPPSLWRLCVQKCETQDGLRTVALRPFHVCICRNGKRVWPNGKKVTTAGVTCAA